MSAHHGKGSVKARIAKRTMPEEDPEFQIAPMIDILLVLLVFFMTIATDQVLQVNKDIVLPVAKDAEKPPKGETKISEVMVNVLWVPIANTGRIEVDGRGEMDAIALQDYITKKREQAEGSGLGDFRVIIRADKSAKYEYVKAVMRAIGLAHVPNVIFSAVDKEMEKH